jgi:hypothetical protein
MKKKTIWKILGIFGIAVILVIAAGLLYVLYYLPHIPLTGLKVQSSPERVENGKYLANHLMVCIDCHSTREWNMFSGPVLAGSEGKGGEKFDQNLGFPGVFYSVNITPYHLSGYSDAEIYRAITSGVGKGDRPLFPIMPYLWYGHLDNEDIYSVIAYIRTLAPIAYDPPPSKADFPVNIIMHTIPKKAEPQAKPMKSDSIAYGKYLVTAGGCIECHTPFVNNKLVLDMAFTGNREFQLPSGILRSANITPDDETGIGKLSRNGFISRFKAYDLATYKPMILKTGDFQTIMPWTMYAGMDPGDLGLIYGYMRTIKPVRNPVVKFTPISGSSGNN